MEPPTSSHGLVGRVQQGDPDAFSLLFEKYRPRLAVLIHYQLGETTRRHTDVDDVLQETLLRAFRDIRQFQYHSPGSFLNWLARISGHVIADLARSQGRQKRAGEHVPFRSESNPGGPEPASYATPSRIFSANEALEQFIEKLDLLPEEYRNIILLVKVDELTTAQAAERLGKTREATSLLLHRAIKRLRSLDEGQQP